MSASPTTHDLVAKREARMQSAAFCIEKTVCCPTLTERRLAESAPRTVRNCAD